MRPLRLEIEGFTAFRERQQVDFSDLDLFAITGPTGAGKTSLLDAMALALYGQVPRMGARGLGQLVSHGVPEAKVLLEFGVGGERYRVSRRLPRTGSQIGRLERAEGDGWVDAVDRGGIRPVNDELEKLLKLDFKSFCKAIVLPQGEFARFLKGDRDERRQTLVALLGLGAYERMGARARERAKELRIKSENVSQILAEQYDDATPESLAAARARLAAARAAGERLAEVLARARAAGERAAASSRQAAAARELAERVAAVAADLAGEVERCRQAELARGQAEEQRSQAVAAAGRAAAGLAAAEADHARHLERTGGPERLARLLDAATGRRALEERAGDAERLVREAEAAVARLAAEIGALAEEAAVLDRALDEARREETAARAAYDAAEEERRRLAARVEAAGSADAARARLLEELARRRETLDGTRAAAASAAAEEVTARGALEALRRDHAAAALAVGLGAGDPCPVCARPLEDHPAAPEDVKRRLTIAGEAADAAREAARTAADRLAAAESALDATRARLDEADAALAAALADAPGLDALRGLDDAAQEAARAAREAVDGAAERREAAAAAAHQVAVSATRAQAELEAAEQQRGERGLAHERARDDLQAARTLLEEHFDGDVPADAASVLERAREELIAAESRLSAARGVDREAGAALTQAEQALAAVVETLQSVDIALGRLRTRAEGGLEEIGRWAEPPQLDALPEPAEARDARASELAEWCTAAAQATRAAAGTWDAAAAAASQELLRLAAGLHPEPADPTGALAAIEAAERGAVEDRALAQGQARQLEGRVEQRRTLESRIAESRLQIARLDVLGSELRGDRFIDFVVQETLDLLAVHASQELMRISDSRYSLVSQGGEFSVVDHVNADEQRSVKTLSGGETFMASLSLALALSTHVSELAGEGLGTRLQAVFIDEGFGSLDPDTLEEVIDALERLREDDLLVGVISHVDALAQRINTGVEVRKDGNRSVVLQVG